MATYIKLLSAGLINGRPLRGAKTVFPASWDEHKILSSIEDSLNNGLPNDRGISHSVNSVHIQVVKSDRTNKVITGFPKARE